MKKLFSLLMFAVLLAFCSCSDNENSAASLNSNRDSGNITVQGQPYDVSKSTIKGIQTLTRSMIDDSNGGDPNFTLDSITFWVGTGSKKAALVIEWHDGKGTDALVWGYRWNGDAYGYNMIRDIVNADSRLIMLTQSTSYGNTIAGLGYNINQTGSHYLIYNGNTNNPQYPVNGIVTTNAYNYNNWTYSDTADHWCSGWYNGYWSYWVKDTLEDAWEYSNFGASNRLLEDGSWDGWSFLDDMSEWGGNRLGSKFLAAQP